jgi:alkanesulfonate monooxygenase SsuD/methylene tetrahydromethanopterin reductase-like flavin-dependent oxidoreductase (luciferase family)
LELARAAERCRYWLAEHHSTPGLAGASPEVLITQVASVTGRIRVGSGGVMRLYTGRPGPYPSVEEALAYPYNAQEVAIAQHASRRSVVGTPEQVKERLLALAADYQADELLVVTITHDFKARLRSYELLAEAFDLARAD